MPADTTTKKFIVWDFDRTLVKCHLHHNILQYCEFQLKNQDYQKEVSEVRPNYYIVQYKPELLDKEYDALLKNSEKILNLSGGIKNFAQTKEIIAKILQDDSCSMAIASYSAYPEAIKKVLEESKILSDKNLSTKIPILAYLPENVEYRKNIHIVELLIDRFLKERDDSNVSAEPLEVILVDDDDGNIQLFSELRTEGNIKKYIDLVISSARNTSFKEGDKEYLLTRFKDIKFTEAIHVPEEENNIEYLEKLRQAIHLTADKQEQPNKVGKKGNSTRKVRFPADITSDLLIESGSKIKKNIKLVSNESLKNQNVNTGESLLNLAGFGVKITDDANDLQSKQNVRLDSNEPLQNKDTNIQKEQAKKDNIAGKSTSQKFAVVWKNIKQFFMKIIENIKSFFVTSNREDKERLLEDTNKGSSQYDKQKAGVIKELSNKVPEKNKEKKTEERKNPVTSSVHKTQVTASDFSSLGVKK